MACEREYSGIVNVVAMAGERKVDAVFKILEKLVKSEADEQLLAAMNFDQDNFDHYFDWLDAVNKKSKKNLITHLVLEKTKMEKGSIGAANPYVIASVVLGKPVADLTSSDLVSVMKTLGGSEISNYNDIFNPSKNSPIFKMDTIDLSQWISQSKTLRKKAIAKNFFTVLKKDLPEIRIHYARVLDEGTQMAEKFLSQGITGKKLRGGEIMPNGQTGLGNPGITANAEKYAGFSAVIRCGTKTRTAYKNDVKQGACLDCYFMAALYSVVMTYYWAHPVNLILDDQGEYTVPFYDYPGDRARKLIKVKPTFPLSTINEFIYAQMTPDNELWVALYEKAYAKYRGYADDTLPGFHHLPGYDSGKDPDIGLLPAYYAMIPLTNLTKLVGSEVAVGAIPPTIYTAAVPPGGKSNYQILTEQNSSAGLTMFATVAWTHAEPPAGYEAYFTTEVIVPCHAYSLIGFYYDGTDNYIVLRNPWANKIDPNNNDFNLLDLASGTWSPQNSPAITFGAASDGIFGVKPALFDQLFEGYGWVRFTVA
jgi:hypothetical protein